MIFRIFCKPLAQPLTEACLKLSDFGNLANMLDRINRASTLDSIDARATALNFFILSASGSLIKSLRWEKNDTGPIFWEGSDTLLRRTNLDVITAEAIVWIGFLMGQLRRADAKRDREMYERVGSTTVGAAGGLGREFIRSFTGVDFSERSKDARMVYSESLKKERPSSEVFASVILARIGCKRFSDPPKQLGLLEDGILPPGEWMPLSAVVGIFCTTMPPGCYQSFKNLLRQFPERFPTYDDLD